MEPVKFPNVIEPFDGITAPTCSGSVCSVIVSPRIRSTGSFGPGDRFIDPRTALGGTDSHVTPAYGYGVEGPCDVP